MDVCGVVDAVGEGAEEWLGRRVVAITKTALGGIAEYAIAPTVSVFDAPPQLDDAEATAFLLTFQTSHLALFRAGPACGPARPWWCTRRPAGWVPPESNSGRPRVPGSSPWPAAPEKGALCASLGADLVVDHLEEDFVEAVLGATDDAGADVVYRPDRR